MDNNQSSAKACADTYPNAPRPKKKRSNMHEGIAVWCDCCSCEAEPLWREVAEKLGISRRHLDRLCANARRPDLELAIAVEDLTKGAVNVRSWLKVDRHSED